MRRAEAYKRRLMSALLCLLLAGCGGAGTLALSERISNSAQVVADIRAGLRDHSSKITVAFDYGSDIYGELNAVAESWVTAALAETEDPREGDYIRCQYGGYTWTSTAEHAADRWHYTLELAPVYACYLSQEEAVTERVADLLRDFAFGPDTPAAEKVAVIYDYLCRNVSYDKVHRKHPAYPLRSTAYAALILRSATCRGFSAALYRLLREAGVACRVITGAAEGEDTAHAWVIAELDGSCYCLDPTWDAGQTDYRYFLKGSAEFADHIPAAEYRTPEFRARWPVSEQSYRKEGT